MKRLVGVLAARDPRAVRALALAAGALLATLLASVLLGTTLATLGGFGPVPPPEPLCHSAVGCCVADAAPASGFCLFRWAADLESPRGLAWANPPGSASSSPTLVLVLTPNELVLCADDDTDGQCAPAERTVLATLAPGSDAKALVFRAPHVYVAVNNASANPLFRGAVFRWAFDPSARRILSPLTAVVHIPHTLVALEFDAQGNLLLAVDSEPAGAVFSIDRAHLALNATVNFSNAAAVALHTAGLLMPTALRRAPSAPVGSGAVYAVDEGLRDLIAPPWGIDLAEENPADELNTLPGGGASCGAPFCWTAWNLPPDPPMSEEFGRGSQFPVPEWRANLTNPESFCLNASNNHVPAAPLPAHWGAAALAFLSDDPGLFGLVPHGDAFVALRGVPGKPAQRIIRVHIASGSAEPLELSDFLRRDPGSIILAHSGTGDEDIVVLGDHFAPSALEFVPCPVHPGDAALLVASERSNAVFAIRPRRTKHAVARPGS